MDRVNVLLVDDKLPMHATFETLFDVINVDALVDLRQPTSPKLPLGGTPMPKDDAFDLFDVAVIDLELFDPKRPFSHKADDLRGGSEILPYLREHAPWLPAVAKSYLLNGGAPHLLPMIGSFGFDGLLPQALLPDDDLTGDADDGDSGMQVLDRQHWRMILAGAVLQRRRALFGPHYGGGSNVTAVDISPSTVCGPEMAGFKEALKVTFHFARELAVEPIAPGHSGARVFKAVVSGGNEQDSRAGYWLVKTSTSPWKLQQEVSSHLEMMRSGAEYGVAVPLLWRGVVVEQRLALIAYHFASDTLPASAMAVTSFPSIRASISSLLKKFYSNGAKEARANRDTLLRTFGPWIPNLRAVENLLPDSFRAFAAAILNQEDGRLAQIVDYTRSRIHGDLHLDNIMVGETPVLIDFSKTKIAALAIDAAKLAADMLIRVPSVRDEELPLWGEASKLFGEWDALAQVFPLTQGDATLFRDFLALYLWEALYFDTTDTDTRDWIRTVLGTATF
jgi:hypothetical protein